MLSKEDLLEEAAWIFQDNDVIPVLDYDNDGVWYIYEDEYYTQLLAESSGFVDTFIAAAQELKKRKGAE